MGNDPYLYYDTNQFSHSDIYTAISLLVCQVILVNDILGDEVDLYLVILILVHWIVKV